MPEIARFDGMAIFINHNDHLPPHMHVEHSGGLVCRYRFDGTPMDQDEVTGWRLKKLVKWIILNQELLERTWKQHPKRS